MSLRKSIILTAALFAASMAHGAPSILNLSEAITDSAIIYPESFETDVHRMMQNWYLQNYTVLDAGADAEADVPATDAVLTQRLSQLPTTIEMPFNQIVKSYINMYTQKRRGLVENMLGMSLYYMPIFEEALEREGLPLELRYLPVIESALNPDAVSRAGATGLWQFMLPTARGLGMEISTLVDERRDPVVSSQMAAKYLKQLYEIYGDWSLAIASYNCGPGNVNKAMRRAGIDPDNPATPANRKDFWSIYYNLPAETRGYVPAFIAANYAMTYYKSHNISPALARRPIITDTIMVGKRVHFEQISSVLDIPIEEIRVLNPQYRQDIIPGDIRPYALRLPSKLVYAYIMSEDSIVMHDIDKYARRSVVEPTDNASATATTTTTRLVVKTHKVQRNETMTKIASRYGVSVTDIKKWNKLSSSKVKRGQRLKIHTYERVVVPISETTAPSAEPQTNTPDMVDTVAPTDSVNTAESDSDTNIPTDSVKSHKEPKATVKSADNTAAQNSKSQASSKKNSKRDSKKAAAAKTHTVSKGEGYWKIAKKYGVTVDELRKANPKAGENLKTGQKLKIPNK